LQPAKLSADVANLAVGAGAGELVRPQPQPPHAARGIQVARCDPIFRLEQRLSGQDAGPLPLLRRQLRARASDGAACRCRATATAHGWIPSGYSTGGLRHPHTPGRDLREFKRPTAATS